MAARDAFDKDHYAALGVAKDATAADVKKAYRALARELHPDTNPAGEERFKAVSEAYDVLSDDTRRREYDEARALFGSGRPGGGGMPFDLGDLFGRAGGSAAGGFGDVLGGLFGQRAGSARTAGRAPRRGADVETTVTLSFLDALRGATVPLRVTTSGACGDCRGSGAAPGTSPRACGVCGGQGMTRRDQGGFAFAEPCAACRGTGSVVETPCPACSGTGVTSQERTLQVRVPVGVEDGQRIRLAGRGGPGDRGGPAGDLFVAVTVSPHPLFGRKGRHLTVTVPVSFPEAVLGAQVTVPTTDAPVTLKVPAGTSSGRTFRVKGRGVPGKVPGDLLVTVQVAVPQDLSDTAREALEAYARATPGDPRADLQGAT